MVSDVILKNMCKLIAEPASSTQFLNLNTAEQGLEFG